MGKKSPGSCHLLLPEVWSKGSGKNHIQSYDKMTEDLRVKSGGTFPQANIINALKCQSKTNKQKMASGEKNKFSGSAYA